MLAAQDSFAGLRPKHYRVILCDPPWNFKCGTGKGSRHPSVNHYETMSLADIGKLPVADLAHPDGARLLLWATMPILPYALDQVKKWGFRYSTCRVWVKTWPKKSMPPWDQNSFALGTGYEVRGNPEPLIIAKIGKPEPILPPKPRALIIAPRQQHSRKPECLRDEIYLTLRGPRCELFARESHHAFDSWGNETTKFDTMLT